MAHQDIAATIKIEERFTCNGEPVMNVYYAKASGTINDALLDEAFTLMNDWENDTAKALRGAGAIATEVVITDMSTILGSRKTYSFDPPVVGIDTGDTMPNNVTLAIKENVGRRGKGINGRKFWIGLTEAHVNGDQVAEAHAQAIVLALGTLRTAFADQPGFEGLAVPHLVVNGVRPATAQSDVISTFSLADNYVDSQVDRLPRHKRRKRHTTP